MKKFTGLHLVSFLASIAGISVSFMLLKEDVSSTAHTIFEYFPSTFGVRPAESWSGAIVLGIFVSILQIVSSSIAFSGKFNVFLRIFSGLVLAAACYFDNWTDIVFRSGNLTGNMQVATITTLAFYTFGSEIAQSLSWIVILNVWRSAISDFMWGWARLVAGFSSISSEWARFKQAAKEGEERGKPIVKDSGPFVPIRSGKAVQFGSRVSGAQQHPKPLSQKRDGGFPEYIPTFHGIGDEDKSNSRRSE